MLNLLSLIDKPTSGEIIINKTENDAAGKHENKLLALNKNPDEWEIVPTRNAKNRGRRIG